MRLKEALKALLEDDKEVSRGSTYDENGNEYSIEETKTAYRLKAQIEFEKAKRNLEAAERW